MYLIVICLLYARTSFPIFSFPTFIPKKTKKSKVKETKNIASLTGAFLNGEVYMRTREEKQYETEAIIAITMLSFESERERKIVLKT